MRLQRSLVCRKTRIAIDPVQRHTRVRDELRCKLRQIGGKLREKVDHWRPNVLLVVRLSLTKPLAIVVTFECSKKGKRFGGKR